VQLITDGIQCSRQQGRPQRLVGAEVLTPSAEEQHKEERILHGVRELLEEGIQQGPRGLRQGWL